ncbi:hypothetical protein M9458_045219, partial [Cirrhinus mrigala]
HEHAEMAFVDGTRCRGKAPVHPTSSPVSPSVLLRSNGLVVRKAPSPEPSRLDDWFLGSRRDSNQPCPGPVPFRRSMKNSPRRRKRLIVPVHVRVLPSSLPSKMGQPGGTRTFPRWSVQLRCIYARKMPPPRGTGHVSHPKP